MPDFVIVYICLLLFLHLILLAIVLANIASNRRALDDLRDEIAILKALLRNGLRQPPAAAPTTPEALAVPTPHTAPLRASMPLHAAPPAASHALRPPPLPAAPTATTAAALPPPATAADDTAPDEPAIETRTAEKLRKLWNRFLFGAEQLPEGVTLEYAIATQWLMRVGIFIFVLGISFFLKYSFDNNLIGEKGRVALTVLAGVGMLVGGMRLLGRRYHVLGLGLAGGGIVVLFWAIYAATNYYQIVSRQQALLLVVLVTAAAAIIAVRLNEPFIALVGIIGGYASPLVLVLQGADFPGIYSYLLVLGIGVFAIGLYRHWHLLNYLGLAFTYGMVMITLDRGYQTADFPVVMTFLTAFFVLYAGVCYAHNLVRRKPSTLIELLGQVLNAAAFFGFSYSLINDALGREWVGVCALAICAFYILHVFFFLRRRLHDRALLVTLLALAAFFLTITMPIVLSAEWLTVSWALQAFLVLWVGYKLDSRFIRSLAYAIYAIMLARLLAYDLDREFGGALVAVGYWRDLAGRLVVFGTPVLAMFGAYRLHRKPVAGAALRVPPESDTRTLPAPAMLSIFLWIGVLFLFLYLNLELNRMFEVLYEPFRLPALSLLWVILCASLVAGIRRTGSRWQCGLLIVVAGLLVGKLLGIDLDSWNLRSASLTYPGWSQRDALMRLIDFGAVAVFFWVARCRLTRNAAGERTNGWVFGPLAVALLFIFTTLELNTFLLIFAQGFRAGGISILWSLFALGFLLYGMLQDVRPCRYVGLLLFAIIVVKVFAADLGALEPLYRIVAAIVLGILVLCGSFIYLRFRLDDATDKA